MREGTSGRERTHNPVVVGSSPTRPTPQNSLSAKGFRISITFAESLDAVETTFFGTIVERTQTWVTPVPLVHGLLLWLLRR